MNVSARRIRRTRIFILRMECHRMKITSKERKLARLMVGALLVSGGTMLSSVASAEVLAADVAPQVAAAFDVVSGLEVTTVSEVVVSDSDVVSQTVVVSLSEVV